MAGRQKGDPSLTRLMLTVWEQRDDVRRAFSVRTPCGHEGFLAWYYIFGVVELGHVPLINKGCAEWLMTPAKPDNHQNSQLGYPKVADWLASVLKPDSFRRNKARLPKRPPTSAETAAVQLQKTRRSELGRNSHPRILVWLSRLLPNAVVEIDRLKPEQAGDWIMTDEAARAHPVLKRMRDLLSPASPQPSPADLCSSISCRRHRPFGVNLIGYAKGQFGIGEAVRMAVRACQAAGIPVSVNNIEPGQEVSQNDSSIAEHISNERPYLVNLFCTTGIETALLLARHGKEIFE